MRHRSLRLPRLRVRRRGHRPVAGSPAKTPPTAAPAAVAFTLCVFPAPPQVTTDGSQL